MYLLVRNGFRAAKFTGLAISVLCLTRGVHAEGCNNGVSANLVNDCGFETVEGVADAGWMKFFAGSELGGWEIISGEIDIQDNDHSGLGGGLGHGGAKGKLHIDLNTEGSTIAQEVSNFEIGAEYELSFDYAMHDVIEESQARVSIAGVREWRIQSTRPGQLIWQNANLRFNAVSSTHILSFTGIGDDPGNGMLIDNVLITRVR